MCGIAGIWSFSGEEQDSPRHLQKMISRIEHRGPDFAGVWSETENAASLHLGFRRLAILDTSPAGHQPMHSHCGRYSIVYNGEIYNFRKIRKQLEVEGYAQSFRGRSDTEVLLAAVSSWGLEKTLKEVNGMFAIALWDRSSLRLHLVRDRLGKKPLYYSLNKKRLIFGSELKSLRAHPHFDTQWDSNAISQFLQFAYVPSPMSIYQNCKKLSPGEWIQINPNGSLKSSRYWAPNPEREESPYDEDELHELLRDATRIRLESDVPLGALLSGGIDSSLVCALAQSCLDRPLKTFSIGFKESDFNEASFAKQVAKHLGTDHHELYLSQKQALDVIPLLPKMFDEPFADSSQIPTYLVAKLAKSHVTVALSGDGGDEGFGGYNRYLWSSRLETLQKLPKPIRNSLAYLANSIQPHQFEQVLQAVSFLIPKAWRVSNPAERFAKLRSVISANTPEALYSTLVRQWQKAPTQWDTKTRSHSIRGPEPAAQWMMNEDLRTYLPDDILTKVDRATMAVSLEARAPLLDYRVIEYANRIPLRSKLRGGMGKIPLRQILTRYLPQELVDRPKMGFAIPLTHWLKQELRDWSEYLLDSQLLESNGLNAASIRSQWNAHLSGKKRCDAALWNVLVFQQWAQEVKRAEATLNSDSKMPSLMVSPQL